MRVWLISLLFLLTLTQLQKERAMSNIFLASKSLQFNCELKEQITVTQTTQRYFYDSLKTTFITDTSLNGHSRLYNLISHSLQSNCRLLDAKNILLIARSFCN